MNKAERFVEWKKLMRKILELLGHVLWGLPLDQDNGSDGIDTQHKMLYYLAFINSRFISCSLL